MGKSVTERQFKPFAAKLLFQFRVVTKGISDKRRTCEERIVTFSAPSARRAIAVARRLGRDAEYRYKNAAGGIVRFEFVGILDMLDLEPATYEGPECHEVWYDIVTRLEPMERKPSIIPTTSELIARIG